MSSSLPPSSDESSTVPPTAQRAGTVNAIDRSKQYTRADNSELLRSLNEAWSKIRRLEAESTKKDVRIGLVEGSNRSYRIVNSLLTSIITVLAWEGVKTLAPIALRWLGLQ